MQNQQTGVNDIADLKKADYQMPDTHKEKQLRACCGCRLVMSETQWRHKQCVNCPENHSKTAQFSGLVSLFMPGSSWVAKWNNLEGKQPGIYAINILEDSPIGTEHIYSAQPKKYNKRKNNEDQMYSDDEEDFYNDAYGA